MAQRQRARSNRNLAQGSAKSAGSRRQYGRDSANMQAANTTAAARSNWQQPSATRGLLILRDRNDPTPLPIPSASRTTAKMMENVYPVPPMISDSKRVQTTWAPSAQAPESAIAAYT